MRSGVVAQGGLDLRERGERRSLLNPEQGPFRCVVVNTRVVGDAGQIRSLSVECDVIPARTQRAIRNVPVLQRQHGVNNVHDLWVPRQSTRVIGSSTPLNVDRTHTRRGTLIGPGTPLGDLDGDMVLLDFIEGNHDYPIIVGALTHERTNRVLRTDVDAGWRPSKNHRGKPLRDEYYVHHYGCEVRINDRGDLLIDTVGAYSDATTEDSTASVGQVRVRVKTSQRLTIAMGNDEDVLEVWKDGSQLRVDLGKNANQRIPLGDDQVTAHKNFLGNPIVPGPASGLLAWAELVKAGIIAGGGTLDNSVLETAVANAKNALDAALSDLAKTKKT